MNQYINPTFGRYQRPQTEMFMDHTYAQIHNYHLNQCHIQSYIQRIKKTKKMEYYNKSSFCHSN